MIELSSFCFVDSKGREFVLSSIRLPLEKRRDLYAEILSHSRCTCDGDELFLKGIFFLV